MSNIGYFLAGAVLGAAGVAAATGDEKARQTLGGLVRGGYGIKENLLAWAERLMEDVEDSLAEARHRQQTQAKEDAQTETAPAAKSGAKGPRAGAAKAKPAASATAGPKATTKAAKPKAGGTAAPKGKGPRAGAKAPARGRGGKGSAGA